MGHHRSSVIACAIIMCSVFALRAEAEESTSPSSEASAQAREHARQAQVHYQLGRFEQALEEYAAAYELDPVPALLYNMGQCHRQLDNYERAIFFYEGFLRGNPNARNRSLVEDLITECRTALERQAEEASEQHDDESSDDEASEHDDLRDDEIDLEDDTESAAVEGDSGDHGERRPVYRRWWFWTVIASVVAASTGLAIWAALREPDVPQGSLGTVDWR